MRGQNHYEATGLNWWEVELAEALAEVERLRRIEEDVLIIVAAYFNGDTEGREAADNAIHRLDHLLFDNEGNVRA